MMRSRFLGRSEVLSLLLLALLVGVSCKKEAQDPPVQSAGSMGGLPPDMVSDVEGNIYPTVVIGSHRWMGINLRTAHYQNGDPIPYVPDNASWTGQLTGAWSLYGTDAGYDQVTGKLYNWYTMIDPRNVCPTGWHVPGDDEWKDLELALGMPNDQLDDIGVRGMDANVGGQMKAFTIWATPNAGAAEGSAFNGLPGGQRTLSGQYLYMENQGHWWTATEKDTSNAWSRMLKFDNSGVSRGGYPKGVGYSIRCVQD
jgi:uncharacterized protein (TIGR02145 family)